MADTKILLHERDMPRAWYNVLADAPSPPQPPLHPGTGQPIGPDDLAPLFPLDLIMQEVSTDAEIPIPEEVADVLRLWRPTPLYRAHRLERALGTQSRIYYKNEGVSPAGSHKPNTAVAQAFYNARAGRRRIATETGAGQWGSSLALACGYFGLECKVLRPEAVPADDDGDVGRIRRPEPVSRHERRPGDARAQSGLAGQPRHRHLRGGRGRGDT